MIKDLWNDGLWGKLILVVCIALVLSLPLFIYGGIKEQARWKQYAKDHACKVTSVEQPSTMHGFNSNGDYYTMSTSSKVAYTCDDGVTYWRND